MAHSLIGNCSEVAGWQNSAYISNHFLKSLICLIMQTIIVA